MEAGLKEAIDRCDRWIDPLREIMFDVIVADSYKDISWEGMVDMVRRARRWLGVALETTRTIDTREYAMIDSWLDQLEKSAKNRDRKGWDMVVEKAVPGLIDIVFGKYAVCITQRKT